MATRVWYGNAQKVAQVNTVTPGGTLGTETFTITINGKSVSHTYDGSGGVAEIVTALVAAFQASTEPEFTEITATDSTTHVTLTADTPGIPFTQTSSATGSATNTTATATASAGPNHWGTAANWSGGAVPVDNDTVLIGAGSVDILYDLDQSSIDLTLLTIHAAYTGKIGLPDYNSSYREYRTTYLTLGTATTTNIGLGDGPGSSHIRLHTGTNATTINVFRLASSSQQGLPALQLQGSNASNVLNAYSGTIGLAVNPSETAQFPTIRVGFENNQTSDVQLFAGTGCTLGGTITQSGGLVDVTTAVTTWTMDAGESTIRGSATLGTLNLDGGTMIYRSTGTMTTANVGTAGFLDFTRDIRARTVTNFVGTGNGRMKDSFKTVTWSNGLLFNRTGIQSGDRSDGFVIDLGEHFKITPAAYP